MVGIPLFPIALWLLGLSYDAAEHVRALMLAGAMAAAYIATYPALEAASPSLVILNDIDVAGSAGLPRQQLFDTMTDAVLLAPRIADLLGEGLVCCQEGRYRLTGKGERLAHLFIGLRKLLRLPAGG